MNKGTEMIKFEFLGGELVDVMIPESLVTFRYTLFAKNLVEAKEKFYTIFPGCSIESIM